MINLIEKLISEIQSSLENNNYLSALFVALTIPDICGKIEYTYKSNSLRYKKWFDEFSKGCDLDAFFRKPYNKNMPYLNGEII